MSEVIRYGVLSDTHGRLPAAVHEAFEGVRRIFHCGDAGSKVVRTELETIAPVRMVHGNMDFGDSAGGAPEEIVVDEPFGELAMHHGNRFGHENDTMVPRLYRHFHREHLRVVLFGHTHQPLIAWHEGVLFVNPGSTSMPKHGSPATVALLEYAPDDDEVRARIVEITR